MVTSFYVSSCSVTFIFIVGICIAVSRSYKSIVLFVIGGIVMVVISYLFYTSSLSLSVSYAQQSSFTGHHASQVYF